VGLRGWGGGGGGGGGGQEDGSSGVKPKGRPAITIYFPRPIFSVYSDVFNLEILPLDNFPKKKSAHRFQNFAFWDTVPSKHLNRGGKFLKELWYCVGGKYNKIIWFYQLG